MTPQTTDMRRVGSALLVVLIHGLVILAVLRTGAHIAEKPRPVPEIDVRFVPSPAPPTAKPEGQPPPIRLISPPAAVSPATGASPPATNDTGSLRGLYFYLYECTPENFANLTEAEKARCASASLSPVPNDTRSLLNQPSRAKDAPHWERALARKKNPALLPCASPQGVGISLATLACLGKAASKGGFGDLDEAPGYGDTPSVVPATKTGVPPMSRAPQSPIENLGK